MHIVDRRLNPKSKSLGNRQRFIRRAKAEIRRAVSDALKTRKVAEIDSQEGIKVPAKSLHEPTFSVSGSDGRRDFVLPGNKSYAVGDRIPKPKSGAGGSGRDGSPDGYGEDEFVFTLTREEFLDVFFEDLALPDLVKTKLKTQRTLTPVRAGYATDGPPARLSYTRTMRNSLARRTALRRPKTEEVLRLEAELAEAENAGDDERASRIRSRLEVLNRKRRLVPFLDPIDLRFRRYEQTPKPTTQAVMFCLMDASASMTEALKDLAKRFFMLLYVFLSRHYADIEIVFIRHTTRAQEVDEETFFRGTETGGTVVSSALREMQRVIEDRYPLDDWNIYAAQASDGHNFFDDTDACIDLLDQLLPICQYYAYVEVSAGESDADEFASPLWSSYDELDDRHANFAMRRAGAPEEIFAVFHDLFARSRAAA